jgi:hypothetical protein
MDEMQPTVVSSSGGQYKLRNSPGFNPITILRHREIIGTVEEAVLKYGHKKVANNGCSY